MTDDMWAGTEFDRKPRKVDAKWIPDELPEDIDAERSFLATVCAPGGGRACMEATLEAEASDFVHPTHKAVLAAAKSLVLKDLEVNSLTLKSELEQAGTLNLVGGYPGLVELLAGEDVERPHILLDVLREKSKLRQLIHAGSRIITDALALEPVDAVLATASEAITRLATDTPKGQLITDLTDLMDDLAEGKAITTANGGRAMTWGDPILDSLCPIPRGEPALIVARPGCGKSALAIQVVCATVDAGIGKPLFLSLEMGREKIKARIAAHLSGTNSKAFRDAHYTARDIEAVMDRKYILEGMKVMFPNQQCPIEEIESLVRHAVDVHGIDCVVLDQFSHIHAPREAKKEQFAIANSMLSQRLTALAKNLNLGWVTLGQINREGEDSRRPTMKDLADTDRLAKDAAVIFGLWNKGTDESQEVWGTIIKNRDDGHKGWARRLATDYGTCRFKVEEQETFVRAVQPKTRFQG